MRILGPVVMAAVMSTVSVPVLAQVDCILPRDVQSLNVPKSDPVYQAALEAEEIILKRGGFIAGLSEPVRLHIRLVLEAHVTARQKALFREAADLQGVTLTDFIISSVHQAAVRALEARHVLELSRRDQQVFVDAVLRPSAPNARLRRAWLRHSPTKSGRSSKSARNIRRSRG